MLHPCDEAVIPDLLLVYTAQHLFENNLAYICEDIFIVLVLRGFLYVSLHIITRLCLPSYHFLLFLFPWTNNFLLFIRWFVLQDIILMIDLKIGGYLMIFLVDFWWDQCIICAWKRYFEGASLKTVLIFEKFKLSFIMNVPKRWLHPLQWVFLENSLKLIFFHSVIFLFNFLLIINNPKPNYRFKNQR